MEFFPCFYVHGRDAAVVLPKRILLPDCSGRTFVLAFLNFHDSTERAEGWCFLGVGLASFSLGAGLNEGQQIEYITAVKEIIQY